LKLSSEGNEEDKDNAVSLVGSTSLSLSTDSGVVGAASVEGADLLLEKVASANDLTVEESVLEDMMMIQAVVECD